MNRKLRRALKAINLVDRDIPKTKQEIQNKYFRLCAQAGELQYKITVFEEELAQLNSDIKKLNQAMHEVQAEENSQPKTQSNQGGSEASAEPSPSSEVKDV